MEELSVGSGSNLINDSWFQIQEYSTGNMLSCTRLAEESVKSIISSTDALVSWHLAVIANAVLKAVQLPASVTNLDTSLTDVNRNALSHVDKV